MEEREKPEDFSLLGGPLHRLGCRVGLVRGGTNTVALGLALGVGSWVILVLLALVEGFTGKVFSLSVIGGHVRLLLVIPLFFLCESLLDPRARVFVRVITDSQVVPETEVPRLNSEIKRIGRWKNSWLPDTLCLLAAVLMSVGATRLPLLGTTAVRDQNAVAGAALWFWIVCLPLFRFLAFRWLWRILLWWYFLWRLARLQLNLVPTHPDGAAGLGYLDVVHAEFGTLIFAISAGVAASFAEDVIAGSLSFTTLYPALVLILAFNAVMFLGPLCIFTPKLWQCRVKGLDTYMDFASRYVIAFEKKWLGKGSAQRHDLLGTNDVQSLADLTLSLNVVTNMRLTPATRRLVLIVAMAATVPMLPLLLLQYPVTELADRLLKVVFSF